MMDEPIAGFPFLPAHYETLFAWADAAAGEGYGVEMGELGGVPEALFVRLPGALEDSFAVWRSLSSAFVVADWRAVASEAYEKAHATLEAALAAIRDAVRANGRNGMQSFVPLGPLIDGG